MRIVIVTIGTRGDVQPYLALALGLKAAGHHVTLCTHDIFKDFVEGFGIPFAPLAGDIRAMLNSDAGRQLLSKRSPIAKIREMTELARPILRELTQNIISATRGADLILGSTLGYFNAITAAQVHRIPLYMAGLQCFTPTGAFPSLTVPPLFADTVLAGPYNRLSFSITNRLLYLSSGKLINQIRAELTGLPPLRYKDYFDDLARMRKPVVYGFSQTVLPRPAEWNEGIHVTGFWFLDQQSQWQPPAELTQFLEAGPPPVYVGFGSMSDRDPEQVSRIVLEALRQTRQRGILLSGWAGLQMADLSDQVLLLDNVPHDWLFPHMAAVVHHGGMGTTAAALRSGAPQVIVPFSSDQPFWGFQMNRLGAAPAPLPRNQLTADRLASAIQQAVQKAEIKAKARTLGQQIRNEDGVAQAVVWIEQFH